MIAPARAGGLRGPARRQRRSRRSAACARPRPAHAWTTSAIARWPARSRPARCAGRARSIASSPRSPDGRRNARSRSPRHPPADHLSAAPPRSRPGVGGRQRCGQPCRKAARGARPRSSTPCCGASAASAHSCRCPRARGLERDVGARYLAVDAVASALAGRALARSLRVRGAESVGAVQQRPGAADAPREHAANHATRRCATRSPVSTSTREPTRFAPDGLVVTAGNPLLRRSLRQDCSSSRTKRRSSSASLPARTGETVLDACASPGGKTTAMAAAMGDRGLIVATDVRGRRVDLLARTVARGRRDLRADRPGRRAAALPFRRSSTACSSTRRARGSARSGAIRTSAGGDSEADLRGARRRAARACSVELPRCWRRRPPGLLDLLERARGERGGASTASSSAHPSSAACGSEQPAAMWRLPWSTTGCASEPCPSATASRRSSPPCW